jgi:pimeloyl-ACP methyl ester carboxylesterase
MYRVGAFVDRDADLIYQPDRDPAAYATAPPEVELRAGEQRLGVDLDLARLPSAPLGIAVQVDDMGLRTVGDIGNFNVGAVVQPDDPRFTDANGKLGMWQPLEFIAKVGAGVYFYEPYDPAKIPVLFVHGAGGHPGNFRFLATHLDRSRFQPWLAYYPSAAKPATAARMLQRWVMLLGARYRPTRFAIVAHSMGGLVSRAAIDQWMQVGGSRRATLERFISISTPWNGHPGARWGADAPVVMPAWPDLVPGSDFLRGLFSTPLPPECSYHLLFSFGGESRLYGEANDGTVTLASELEPAAQRAASTIRGFDADHGGILERPETSERVNEILGGIAP